MSSADDNRGPSSGDLERQAWAWLRRLSSGDVTSWDADAFKRWLHTSPAHHAAFSEARQAWALIKPAAREVLVSNPEAARQHVRALNGPNLGRRAFLGAAASAAVVAGVAVLHPPADLWPAPAAWGADFRTATGEQRTISVASRVNVMLNTETSIRRETAGAKMVGIRLLTGEAAVDVAAGGAAFAVIAGAGRSEANAGRFEVRRLASGVCVTCIDGAVSVDHPAGRHVLRAGDQTVYDDATVGRVRRVAVADVSAWRNGMLVFRETPLSQVLDEINRYRRGRVVLMNASLRSQPVSGSFDITLLDMAVAQLERTFGLNARALPGGLVILS
ncbi:FecR family protein [Pandoraea communis]|uniref:Fe2+-dicitrate sensor, membrane protein n=1 Tax=Pandoraea communis TaxID=2508297 RepID=A0A5E4YMC6_9BURK|nr:FecR domain-containing protein [Pandoraea communis]MDM8358838.1 FecR domain-containing protein [Pandoraea communis]VVE49073.1 Fe2+-dicitrate sensor, membrane protein [Pandoraea communis]